MHGWAQTDRMAGTVFGRQGVGVEPKKEACASGDQVGIVETPFHATRPSNPPTDVRGPSIALGFRREDVLRRRCPRLQERRCH